MKFKVNKQSNVISKLDQICKAIHKELDAEIKKGNAPGNKNLTTLPFAYYPQGLKNTVASLLQSFVPNQPASKPSSLSDRVLPYGKILQENVLQTTKKSL